MAVLLNIELKGDKELLAKLARLGSEAPRAVERGMYRWAEETMGESKQNYVPVDTGQLRASGYVLSKTLQNVPAGAQPGPDATALVGGPEPVVVLGFGGPATPYALAVHENPRSGKTGGLSPTGKRYKAWARVGEWKYLQTPVQIRSPELAPTVARELDVLIARIATRQTYDAG